MQKTIILGDEFDRNLRTKLIEIMNAMGATKLSGDWAIGGSQELETMTISLHGRIVEIEAETYVGLSITGDEDLITEIASRVGKKPSPSMS